MRESVIEKYLVKQVRSAGGDAFKWSSPSTRGVPDRLCIFPKGVVVAVELKALGRGDSLTALQKHQINRLRLFGLRVEVIDSKEGVDLLIVEVMSNETGR
jgi:hypothetical protein